MGAFLYYRMEVFIMGISITVEVNNLANKLSPKVTQAIRSSIQSSLLQIKNKWSQSTKGISIKYPLDSQGLSGDVGLPSLSDLKIAPLNIPTSLPILDTNFSTILGFQTPMNKNTYSIGYNPKMGHNSYKKEWIERQKNKKVGLHRIVQGYQPKKKKDDPIQWMRRVPDVEVDKIAPYAQITFVDILTNNLNGIR